MPASPPPGPGPQLASPSYSRWPQDRGSWVGVRLLCLLCLCPSLQCQNPEHQGHYPRPRPCSQPRGCQRPTLRPGLVPVLIGRQRLRAQTASSLAPTLHPSQPSPGEPILFPSYYFSSQAWVGSFSRKVPAVFSLCLSSDTSTHMHQPSSPLPSIWPWGLPHCPSPGGLGSALPWPGCGWRASQQLGATSPPSPQPSFPGTKTPWHKVSPKGTPSIYPYNRPPQGHHALLFS